MEQNFRTMVQETIKKDMQELLNGPIKQTHDIIAQVYEMGLMKGLEIQRKNLQFSFASKWINVLDNLPEEDPDDKGYSVEVIGHFPDGRVSKCFCSIEEDIWFIEGLTCDKPTHWMPMPQV